MRLPAEMETIMIATRPIPPIQSDLPRFDRRDFPRRRLSMHVQGLRLDHTLYAKREPVVHLTICDVSSGGLCAISQSPLAVGEHVAVFFPPEGTSRGWDAHGRVLRVEAQRLGWRIGVSFEDVAAV